MDDFAISHLKILNNISKDHYITKKSSLNRINADPYLNNKTRDFLYGEVIKKSNDLLYLLKDRMYELLQTIPIYKKFLKDFDCLSIYDCCDLIVLIDINNFDMFKNLLSYSGMSPKKTVRYNKELKKLLLKISKKLSENDFEYRLIYNNSFCKYEKKYPYFSDLHLKHMARRVVVKKFLKEFYKMWKDLNKEEFL